MSLHPKYITTKRIGNIQGCRSTCHLMTDRCLLFFLKASNTPTETATRLEGAKNVLQSAAERYPTLEQLRARRLAKFGFEAIQKSPRVNSYSVSQDYLTTGVEIVGQLAEALSYRNVSLTSISPP